MGKDAAVICGEFHARLSQIARELTGELYPRGLPRGTKFSELEAVAGALGDEMARQLIEINVQEQADGWPEEELGECPVCGGPAREGFRHPGFQGFRHPRGFRHGVSDTQDPRGGFRVSDTNGTRLRLKCL